MTSAHPQCLRRYTFKLYPNPAQAAALHHQRRMMGELYNALLQQRIEAYRRRGKTLSYYDQCKEITALRREMPEWREMSSSSMAATAQRLDRAFQSFFRRAKAGRGASSGFPRFKRTEDYPSLPFKRHGDCWRLVLGEGLRNGRLYVRGAPGMIRLRGRLPDAPKKFKTCDVLWREGCWWLSLVVEMPKRRERGEGAARITFDLVSEFARIEVIDQGDGGLAAGLTAAEFSAAEGRIGPQTAGLSDGSGSAVPESRSDQGHVLHLCFLGHGSAVPESRSDQGAPPQRQPSGVGSAVPESRSDQGSARRIAARRGGSAVPESRSDQGAGIDFEGNVMGSAAPKTLQQAMSRCRRGSHRYRKLRLRKARLEARAARRRREQLHEWTTAIQRRFAAVTVIAPRSIGEATRSGRGDAFAHGAEVRFKAAFNRRILSFAPAEARAQIEYKLGEAGGAFTSEAPERHPVDLGNAVVAAAKAVRKAKRRLKRV
jgi:transposase